MDYKIKVITLEKRKDRRELFDKRFSEYNYEYFFGKDGKQYKLSEKDLEWIKGNDYEKFGIHTPSLVCANTAHIDLLKLCIKENIPYIIFEDDTEIIKSIDFKFEDIVKKDLDVFWLMPNNPSILCYIVWPSGAKKLIESVEKEGGLKKGLDEMWHKLKNTKYLKEEQIHDKYFHQRMGSPDSDITEYLDYKPSTKTII